MAAGMASVSLLFWSFWAGFVYGTEPVCGRFYVVAAGPRATVELPEHYFIQPVTIDHKVSGRERLAFDLPDELSGGRKRRVDLTVIARYGAIRELTGALGKGICEGPWNRLRCRFFFDNWDESWAEISDFAQSRSGALIVSPHESRCR